MILLCGCAGQPVDAIDDSPLVITAQALPRLLVAVPGQLDDFMTTGYDSFYAELKTLSVENRFEYDVVSMADASAQTAACAQAAGYDWFYLHPTNDQTLSSDLAQLSGAQTQVVLYGDYDAAVTGIAAKNVYLDYQGIGLRTGEYIANRFAGESGKLSAIMFGGSQEWYQSYYDAVSGALGGAMTIHMMDEGATGQDMTAYFDTIGADELSRVRCIIAPDGQSAQSAIDALLDYHSTGSISLKISLVAFVGADDEYIDNIAYSPIDKVTFNLSPTLMLNAAKYLSGLISGEALGDTLAIDFTIVDKDSIADFKLSDEYLYRFLQ